MTKRLLEIIDTLIFLAEALLIARNNPEFDKPIAWNVIENNLVDIKKEIKTIKE